MPTQPAALFVLFTCPIPLVALLVLAYGERTDFMNAFFMTLLVVWMSLFVALLLT